MPLCWDCSEWLHHIEIRTNCQTVADCIDAYIALSKKVFKIDNVLMNAIPLDDDRCRFSSTDLENEIKTMLRTKLGGDDYTMGGSQAQQGTKTFVVATKAVHADGVPTVFRSYKGNGVRPSRCKIWQAARATSAAPSYFREMFIDDPPPGMDFMDGGLLHNNPSSIALQEARCIWPTIKHFGLVSIGTGRPKSVR